MPITLPTPHEADGTYLAYPVVRYLLSLTSVPTQERCIYKDIWLHLLRGEFPTDEFDIRPSILWGKGMPDDYSPSKFWVLSVLQRVQKPGSAWPNTLLVVGYRHLPSAAKESDPDLQATGVEDYEVPTDSPDWYPIFDKLRRHLVAIAHVNTSIPEFVAITVGRFVRFVKVNARESGVGLRLIPMESDPVYDIAHQNHAVQQILSHMNEGREVIQTLIRSYTAL